MAAVLEGVEWNRVFVVGDSHEAHNQEIHVRNVRFQAATFDFFQFVVFSRMAQPNEHAESQQTSIKSIGQTPEHTNMTRVHALGNAQEHTCPQMSQRA